jgi:hypothetical protein
MLSPGKRSETPELNARREQHSISSQEDDSDPLQVFVGRLNKNLTARLGFKQTCCTTQRFSLIIMS